MELYISSNLDFVFLFILVKINKWDKSQKSCFLYFRLSIILISPNDLNDFGDFFVFRNKKLFFLIGYPLILLPLLVIVDRPQLIFGFPKGNIILWSTTF